MEQAVLQALTQAMGSQSGLQLGAMQAENNMRSASKLVNDDLSKQSSSLSDAATRMHGVNIAMSCVSTILGAAMVIGMGVTAVGACGGAAEALTSFVEPGARILQGAAGMTQGALGITQGQIKGQSQAATAQASLDGATTNIIGSVIKTITGSIQGGSSANATIGQKTSEAIQAYGRAQKEQ